jgi:hypothetical protein
LIGFVILRAYVCSLFKLFVERFNERFFYFVYIGSAVIYEIHTTIFGVTGHTVFDIRRFSDFINIFVRFYKFAFFNQVQMSRNLFVENSQNSRRRTVRDGTKACKHTHVEHGFFNIRFLGNTTVSAYLFVRDTNIYFIKIIKVFNSIQSIE